MNNKLKYAIAAAPLLLSAASVAATGQLKHDMNLSTPGTEKVLHLPEAAAHSRVISLGSAVDSQSGEVVEGYAVIHRRGNNVKPDHAVKPPKPPKDDAASSCYSYMARGAMWKTVEPWYVNPTNPYGLTSEYVLANLVADVDKWEDAADGTMGDGAGADILGGGASTIVTLVADMSAPDGLNEVYFGDIEGSGVIAVTVVWGVFGGPPKARQLMEWDMVFEQVDFAWSATGEEGMMDFENIATHELGHSIGLGHPDSTCVEETMYAYADYGETMKRDLNAGDIAGTDGLY
ncbi:MAG: matrixin family metalloprotease [Patescibacteria group bacterium]|nr:matrixin family metalloprotease [Patescibacteria group bacterium]